MSVATLTSKGQITIPLNIREQLHLTTGDNLEFLVEGQGKIIVLPLTKDVKGLKNVLPKSSKKVSIEEMNEVIAKRGGTTS